MNHKQNKKGIINQVTKRFQTTMIGALFEFEKAFGYLWGHEKEEKDLTDDELVMRVRENIEEKRDFYSKLLKGVEVSNYKNIQKFAEEHLIPLYKNKHITGLLKFALDIRNKKRVKEYGSFQGEYKIPERVLKLSDYKNNPELIDKYFGVEDGDSDSD